MATYLVLVLVDSTVGLRVSEESERKGLDKAVHGETIVAKPVAVRESLSSDSTLANRPPSPEKIFSRRSPSFNEELGLSMVAPRVIGNRTGGLEL